MCTRLRLPWRIVAGLVVAMTAAPLSASTLLKLERLPELVAQSRRAVLARVVEVRHGFDEHRAHSTFVSLSVEDVLFGRNLPLPGELLSIKIYGAPVPLEDGSRVFVEGTPEYLVGERYLLLLLDDSGLGFTNTVGLFQGVFRVDTSSDGLVASSLAGNHHVLGGEGLSATGAGRAGADAPVSYESLREVIVNLWRDGSRPRGEGR